MALLVRWRSEFFEEPGAEGGIGVTDRGETGVGRQGLERKWIEHRVLAQDGRLSHLAERFNKVFLPFTPGEQRFLSPGRGLRASTAVFFSAIPLRFGGRPCVPNGS